MRDNIVDIFNITYTNSVASSHIVFSTQSEETFYQYQLKMISHNQQSLGNLIPPDYRKWDNHLDFFYDITSKITMTDYLLKNVLSKQDVIRILLMITETLVKCESYLLSADKFILDADYIYLDPGSETIFLIYIPLKQSFDATRQLKDFIIGFISIKAKISTDYSDNYTQRILEYMKDDKVTIHNIKEMLSQLDSKPAQSGFSDNPMYESPGTDETNMLNSAHIDIARLTKQKKAGKRKVSERTAGDNIKIPKCTVDDDNCELSLKKQKVKKNIFNDKTVMILLGMVPILFITGVIFIINMGGEQKGAKILGLFIITAGIGYIAAKKTNLLENLKIENILSGKEKRKKVAGKQEVKEESVSRERQINIPIPIFKFTDNDKKENNEANAEIPDSEYLRDVVCKTPDSSNTMSQGSQMNTVLLCNSKKRVLYLTKLNTDSKIFINTTPFVIGRMSEYADYAINNPAIGKSHCEISFDENYVYVKDLGSKNGTYINDIKIEPGKTFPVQDGDRLVVANEGFLIKFR